MSKGEKNLAEVLEKIASMDEPQRTEMQRVQGFIMRAEIVRSAVS